MRNELAATNLYYSSQSNHFEKEFGGEDEMDIEVDMKILDAQQQYNTQISASVPVPNTSIQQIGSFFIFYLFKQLILELTNGLKPGVSLDHLLADLTQRLTDKQEMRETMEYELDRIQGQIVENTDSIHKVFL
jgi:hypothetical protein